MRIVLVALLACGCGSSMNAADAGPCDGGSLGADGGCVPAPKLGEPCSAAGFSCEAAATALECKLGNWVALPCRGPGGCSKANGTVSCDMTGSLAGDACASSAEGRGLCTADGLGTLECRDGVFLKTNTCRTCSVSGGLVTCQP